MRSSIRAASDGKYCGSFVKTVYNLFLLQLFFCVNENEIATDTNLPPTVTVDTLPITFMSMTQSVATEQPEATTNSGGGSSVSAAQQGTAPSPASFLEDNLLYIIIGACALVVCIVCIIVVVCVVRKRGSGGRNRQDTDFGGAAIQMQPGRETAPPVYGEDSADLPCA